MPGISTSDPEPEPTSASGSFGADAGAVMRNGSSPSTAEETLYLVGGARSPLERNGDVLLRPECWRCWDVSPSSSWRAPDGPRSCTDGEEDGHVSISDNDDCGCRGRAEGAGWFLYVTRSVSTDTL